MNVFFKDSPGVLYKVLSNNDKVVTLQNVITNKKTKYPRDIWDKLSIDKTPYSNKQLDKKTYMMQYSKKQKNLGLGKYSIVGKFKSLLSRSNRLGIEVNIDLDFYKQLIDAGCYYCGTNLSHQSGYCLDRIDPHVGYKKDNVVSCCKHCNYLKGTLLNKEETLAVINVLASIRNRDKDKIWEGVLTTVDKTSPWSADCQPCGY